jgi:dihydrofolate reductase
MTDDQPFDFRSFHAQFELAMIVACGTNGVIGIDGDLPWHLPEDLKHFMRSTKRCPVVMGRKTFESLEKPLPDRLNIVVSSSMDAPDDERVQVVSGLEQAIEAGQSAIEAGHCEAPVWIAGGGTIYTQLLQRVDLVVRTIVAASPHGDAYFPDLSPQSWKLDQESHFSADDRHEFGFKVQWWVRIGGKFEGSFG